MTIKLLCYSEEIDAFAISFLLQYGMYTAASKRYIMIITYQIFTNADNKFIMLFNRGELSVLDLNHPYILDEDIDTYRY